MATTIATPEVKQERQSPAGGFFALGGAALLAIGVFLDWLTPGRAVSGEEAITGWDISSEMDGMDKLYIGNFWEEGFSPIFAGMAVLIAAGVLAVIGLWLVTARKRPGRGPGIGLRLLALLAFLMPAANLLSLFTFGPGTGVVNPGMGMWLSVVGGGIGFLGISLGSGGTVLRRTT